MSETDGKGAKKAAQGRQVGWDWRVVFRVVYLVVVLAVTLPMIFFALAAYQFQIDAKAIAEEQELDAQELMWRAAYLNQSLHALQLNGEPPTQAPDRATELAGAQQPAATSATDPGTARPDTDQRAACVQGLAPLCAGAQPPANAKADAAALVLAAELQRFDSLSVASWIPFYGRPSALAELPGWALTLVVTLVAGLLGSLIYVLKATLRQRLDTWSMGPKAPTEPRPWSWYLLRPVFGVVIALGTYVALQSGMLVFDGAVALEPSAYITAAVGLIAGLLSWQTIETIERVGQQWLSSNRPQWGYGLARFIEERGKKTAQLAKDLEVSEKLLDDWVKQQLPVPKDKITRLAAALETHPDELFQPIPPWRRNKGAGQQ